MPATSPRRYDTIVLGAGAAGMLCAAETGKRGRRVLLLDHGDRPGRKILISGGGRCNFTNLHCTPANFLSENPHFSKSALARYTPQDFIRLVERYRIPYHHKTLGQLFCDGSAQAIVTMLEAECREGNVELRLRTPILHVERSIDPTRQGFTVHTPAKTFESDTLVVATGGLSIPKMGATGIGYHIARSFGLRIVDPRPALVPLTFQDADRDTWADLSGLSTEVIATTEPQKNAKHTKKSGPGKADTSGPANSFDHSPGDGRASHPGDGHNTHFLGAGNTSSISEDDSPFTLKEESNSPPHRNTNTANAANDATSDTANDTTSNTANDATQSVTYRAQPTSKQSAQVQSPRHPRPSNRPAFREKLLITHRGLSGPAVLQISSYCHPGTTVFFDLAPGTEVFTPMLRTSAQRDANTAFAILREHLPQRLAERWLQTNLPADWKNASIERLEATLHAWQLTPSGDEGYAKAEVTAGGVHTADLDSSTLQAKSVPGLAFIGEVVDVTGHLGGHNFQWAWASAVAAAHSL